MKRVLIVGDSPPHARDVATRLRQGGYSSDISDDAHGAQRILPGSGYDAVVADLERSEAEGLRFVDHVRREYPRIPVVVMTAAGCSSAAAEALRRGAVSYLPKRRLDRDLLPTLSQVLEFVRPDPPPRPPLDCCHDASARFVLQNDVELVPSLVAHVGDMLRMLQFGDEEVRIRVSVALTEAVTNAILHGNLELHSDLREEDPEEWDRLLNHRRGIAPYHDRRVIVDYRLNRDSVEFRILDEGPGFDPDSLPDPTAPELRFKPSGRGVLLMRTFMDEVRFNRRGNEVTLTRRAGS